MKTMKFLTMITLALFIGITTTSCSGDDGDTGAQGIAGVDGTDGTDGTDGNANVTSVVFTNYNLVIGDNDFPISEITQEIFDSGFVYSYVRVPNASIWEEIPISTGGNVQLETVLEVGNVRLQSTFAQTLDFRFVIVASSN